MWKNIDVPETVAERKIIVYKPRVNLKTIRSIAENMKTQMFRKFVFVKPKPEEVHIVSIDKYFEPYVFVDGEYCIVYSKKWVHNIKVDETMQELTIFGENIKPKSLKGRLRIPCRIIQLNGHGRFKIEKKANIIFDKNWKEVGVEQLPFLPFEEQPERILGNLDRNCVNTRMTTEKEVEILKSRIIQRPSEVLTIHHELFKVSERAEIYKPMYTVVVHNDKTQKEIVLIIDAITGKTTSIKPKSLNPIKKEANKEKGKSFLSHKNEDIPTSSIETSINTNLEPKSNL
ncbi:hypothetical protein AC477_03650 [miscellaneous Crenarchaeota group-1 archaeon SG8-32-1]|uniref:PepSY domain-containing protein n=1 Tax=miscellaneous Crenarchaeota group-1 archaeon SG8-32-1 TaxID=1685124 RepID=A0A0M0BTH4_9ARCH|nr:MAG: hypothetical protein AC477_03650 [miscellaneous Crenarchaeota group-1 archaeon SG8-32-1]